MKKLWLRWQAGGEVIRILRDSKDKLSVIYTLHAFNSSLRKELMLSINRILLTPGAPQGSSGLRPG